MAFEETDKTSEELDTVSEEMGLKRQEGWGDGEGNDRRERRRKEPKLPSPMATIGGGLRVFEEREQRDLRVNKITFFESIIFVRFKHKKYGIPYITVLLDYDALWSQIF
jgi:hypothetical protein